MDIIRWMRMGAWRDVLNLGRILLGAQNPQLAQGVLEAGNECWKILSQWERGKSEGVECMEIRAPAATSLITHDIFYCPGNGKVIC